MANTINIHEVAKIKIGEIQDVTGSIWRTIEIEEHGRSFSINLFAKDDKKENLSIEAQVKYAI